MKLDWLQPPDDERTYYAIGSQRVWLIRSYPAHRRFELSCFTRGSYPVTQGLEIMKNMETTYGSLSEVMKSIQQAEDLGR